MYAVQNIQIKIFNSVLICISKSITRYFKKKTFYGKLKTVNKQQRKLPCIIAEKGYDTLPAYICKLLQVVGSNEIANPRENCGSSLLSMETYVVFIFA